MSEKLQAKRVYKSENFVFSDEKLLSEIQLKIFFLKVIGDDEFIAKYGYDFQIFLCGTGLFDYSFAGYKEIYMLKNEHWTMSSVLHELAHSVKRVRKNPHGKAFCNRYLYFIRKYLSEEKSEQLKIQFKKNKVSF